MDKRLKRILPRVQKPARYTGGEYNQILKDPASVDIRLAFCFPDTYEIGMSNLGLSILYHTMNSLPFVWCERVFAPWGDMYAEMKQAGIPLYALESGDPLSAFDSLAFSIGYEMAYTTVLDMLDMAGLPLRSEDRPELLPLVWAGGTAAVNAEPMAPFIDLFVIGEGEEMNNELLTLLRQAKLEGWSKHEFLCRAARRPSVTGLLLHRPPDYPLGIDERADARIALVLLLSHSGEGARRRHHQHQPLHCLCSLSAFSHDSLSLLQILTPPSRRRVTAPTASTRTTVDGTPPGETPPSKTMSAESPTSASAAGTSVAGCPPLRFALVTRRTPPQRERRRRVHSCAGTRSPSYSPPLGSTSVSAPGQCRAARASAPGGKTPPRKRFAESASAARSAIGFLAARPLMV